MTTPNIKVRIVRKPTLKLKVLPRFPSNVTVESPILLDRSGGNYDFSLDIAAISSEVADGLSIDASQIISGTLPTARLGNIPVSKLNSGTGATTSTVWRGDGAWANGVAAQWNITPGGGVANLRLGVSGSGTVPYIDFLDNAGLTNYGVRLLASGSSTADGSGTLTLSGGLAIHPLTGVLGLKALSPGATGTTVAATATLAGLFDGSAASPHTANTPSVSISRYEAQNSAGFTGDAPALYVETSANNTGGGNPNACAIIGRSTQIGGGDTVGVVGQAWMQVGATGSHTAYGGFFDASAYVAGAAAFTTELFTGNFTGVDVPYIGLAPYPKMVGAHIGAGGNNLCTTGIWVSSATGGGATQWDVGIAFTPGAVKTAAIQDDSSSVTILKATGSHTFGIDLSGATFSGNSFKGPGGFLVSGSADIAGTSLSTSSAVNAGGISVSDGTVSGIVQASSNFTHSLCMGTNSAHTLGFLYGGTVHASLTSSSFTAGTAGATGAVSLLGATGAITLNGAAAGTATIAGNQVVVAANGSIGTSSIANGLFVFTDVGVGGSALVLFDAGTAIVTIVSQTTAGQFVTADPGAGTSKWWVQPGGKMTNRYAATHTFVYTMLASTGGAPY